jgi:hypothetical protein
MMSAEMIIMTIGVMNTGMIKKWSNDLGEQRAPTDIDLRLTGPALLSDSQIRPIQSWPGFPAFQGKS